MIIIRYSWDEQNIRWFLDASAYTGFHKALARKIAAYMEPGDMLCDAGCGLGRIDLELAPYVSELTAIDICENATGVLRGDAEAAGASNLHVICGDALSLSNTFDVVLLSFFGQSNITDFMRLCRRRLIRVVGAENKSSLYPERYRNHVKDTAPVVYESLTAQGVAFKLERHTLEFGQPLRSQKDAEQYILSNAPQASVKEVNEFLDEHITHTGRDDFPLYLPNKKGLGVFILEIT